MTEKEIREYLLKIDTQYGILRKLMSKEEIRIANQMVKEGLLYKGVSDDRQRSVVYFVNN